MTRWCRSSGQDLFDGPIDIVGDVHGEIEALESLLRTLGYEDGLHPEGRRLVFLGDLTDRGPDSPAVIDFVKGLVDTGNAQCVLGNHDLNILLDHRKYENHWFFGEASSLDGSGEPTPAVLADDTIRQRVLDFFRSLPLVLEREDLRVVHACWDDRMVEIARQAPDVVELYGEHAERIDADLKHRQGLDTIDQGLEHQNRNPVKVLTSGKERRTDQPFEAAGKLRHEERVCWWKDYDDGPFCVFGHYSHCGGQTNSSARAICIDFGVGKRWGERKSSSFSGEYQSRLAALRFPELVVVFDDGKAESLNAKSLVQA